MNPSNSPTTFQLTGRSLLLLCLICLAAPCVAQTETEAEDAWRAIKLDIRPDFGSFTPQFQHIPREQYAGIVALERKWRNPEFKAILDVQKRAEKFIRDNAPALIAIRNATRNNLSRIVVNAGIVAPQSAASFVFVPLPCPSLEVYEKASSFIEFVCEIAQKEHLSVVIVRSYNGDEESVKEPLKKGEYWNDKILELPKQYARFVNSGTLKIVDSFPGGTQTPEAFLFRNGECILTGNPQDWVENPKPIIEKFIQGMPK
ncbi:MAG: hypothetical protein NTY98_05265 [Verrucomicrobia bacterium]|nr:hypothetical protein [Verrucomicrobiota bacterium]